MPTSLLCPDQPLIQAISTAASADSASRVTIARENMTTRHVLLRFSLLITACLGALLFSSPIHSQTNASQTATPPHAIVLRAARLLDVETGRIATPGEILVQGNLIVEVGSHVTHPHESEFIDLGDTTLLPGLIDAHVHLFLHPGAEDLQTVQESVPQRTILATIAARDDLFAGFTAERDMGTEGAGSADTAVRNAINNGLIPGPRLRISGNAIDILGGHEDAIGYNPAQHVLSNATYANNSEELITAIRGQLKEGADFIKIYETGPDKIVDGRFSTPYQYTEEELAAAVHEAARTGHRVAVHAMGEPGALLRRAGRSSLHRPRSATQRRNHAPDARKTDFCGADFRDLRILRRASQHSGAGRAGCSASRPSRAGIQKTDRCRHILCRRLRRRPLSPRHASKRIRVDGEIRDVAARRAPGWNAERRQIIGLAKSNRRAKARL